MVSNISSYSFEIFISILVALTQLSKLVPNLTIIATASSHKFDVLRAHIHYLYEHDIDYTEDVKKYISLFKIFFIETCAYSSVCRVAPEGVDLILDCMGGDDCERGLALLKFNGKYIMYGTSSVLSWDVKNLFGLTKGMTNVSLICFRYLFSMREFLLVVAKR